MSNYTMDDKGCFIIQGYNRTKPFASFIPGIAGVMGIPLWCFYVNRGQGIAGFGIKDKDGSIMEFSPANQAYQRVYYEGFRTFIKQYVKDTCKFIEPFSVNSKDARVQQNMYIKADSLEIEQVDKENGLSVNVLYFILPEEDFGGLVRKVTIRNTAKTDVKIEVLDGMAAIVPYGLEHAAYKEISNTLMAWMEVYNLQNNIPFYKVRSSTKDSAEVSEISGGHFYLSFIEDCSGEAVKPIVDRTLVFGSNTSGGTPDAFLENPLKELLQQKQVTVNKVPCGFTAVEKRLPAGEKLEIYTIVGHVDDIEGINSRVNDLACGAYIRAKQQEVEALVEDITQKVWTRTASAVFDAYCKQCYLDNVLRGGYPLLLGDEKEPVVYHVFSRKHGDLERDYNFFSHAPEIYSQGNGNFRDVNQNRRMDTWFTPKVDDFNIILFMSLIQTDGYNPLVVKGCSFRMEEDKAGILSKLVDEEGWRRSEEFFSGTYTPGKLVRFLRSMEEHLKVSWEEFFSLALRNSKQSIEAEFGEGYWIDHWTYNLDLIEGYLAIFPDRWKELLFEKKVYRYFDSAAQVRPRRDKYVLCDKGVRQYDAVEENEEKERRIASRKEDANWMRTGKGIGRVYITNLYEKLLSLALNKFLLLDPGGMGIEMEANKPGWNDSLNGLPGLFGSSMAETFELKRLLLFLLQITEPERERVVHLPREIEALLNDAEQALNAYWQSSDENRDHIYWETAASLREKYREETGDGFSGELEKTTVAEINGRLQKFLSKVEQGIERSLEYGDGIYPTYFTFEATEYEKQYDAQGVEKTNAKGFPKVWVKKFTPKRMQYFLEGPVRAMKTLSGDAAKGLYHRIRESGIYDKKLKMYKVNAPLLCESAEIGRSRAFTPGWLENESVFLHMEYKYLLEVLKSGLYDEFFEDMRNALVPFLDSEVYGRSPLENSSFIASSANPDASLHGAGFVARLSGSTAEFLSMWSTMMAGEKPFRLRNGQLCLTLKPILPQWLFEEQGVLSFRFLGNCDVTYHNPAGKNTYGKDGVTVHRIVLATEEGAEVEFQGGVITEPFASKVREGRIRRIQAYLA